ncbi:MFS transporter [Sphingopyxis panaciterrulae]|uniref:MFS family permease n=1 Tax=Sphingopyxis panaciterrulae TaxID=462372 RepID=A0A7W9B742_9SPHN|nr:MFS transporter [Sphingopyxis panaciterrulae]MBB5707453.1 MFS family permease [Sphingopyxis panaciterrulae]
MTVQPSLVSDTRGSNPFTIWLVAPLLLVTILNPLNSAMLTTALVPIGRAFPGQETIGGWLVASLYLTAAIAQPVLGSFADRFGARRTLVWATVILGLGGIAGIVAQDMATLILSRVLIGFGTSSAYPCAVAIIRQRAHKAEIEPPARILGWLAAASSVAVAAGPPLGGLVTEWLGWRGTFAINLPLAIIAFIAIWLAVPANQSPRHGGIRVDWAGIALFTGFMTALMFFLMHLETRFDAKALGLGLIGLTVFALVERKRASPFVDVGLLRSNLPLTLTYGNHAAFNFVNYCFFYSIPQWSQVTLSLSLTASGLMLMPVAVASFIGALLPTRGRKGCMTEMMGASLLIINSASLFLLALAPSAIGILILSLGFGTSFGILNMSNQQRLLDYAPLEQSGSAAGLLRTSAYLGAMLSAPLVAYLMADAIGTTALKALSLATLPISLLPLATVVADIHRGRQSLAATPRTGRET